jgi:hypothetical protein
MLHVHLSFGAETTGQLVADVTTPPLPNKSQTLGASQHWRTKRSVQCQPFLPGLLGHGCLFNADGGQAASDARNIVIKPGSPNRVLQDHEMNAISLNKFIRWSRDLFVITSRYYSLQMSDCCQWMMAKSWCYVSWPNVLTSSVAPWSAFRHRADRPQAESHNGFYSLQQMANVINQKKVL